jgi:hypothetical protein
MASSVYPSPLETIAAVPGPRLFIQRQDAGLTLSSLVCAVTVCHNHICEIRTGISTGLDGTYCVTVGRRLPGRQPDTPAGKSSWHLFLYYQVRVKETYPACFLLEDAIIRMIRYRRAPSFLSSETSLHYFPLLSDVIRPKRLTSARSGYITNPQMMLSISFLFPDGIVGPLVTAEPCNQLAQQHADALNAQLVHISSVRRSGLCNTTELRYLLIEGLSWDSESLAGPVDGLYAACMDNCRCTLYSKPWGHKKLVGFENMTC